MKKIMLNIALFAFIGIATISCKNNNEAETTQAQEVAEAAPVAVEYTVDTEASQIHWKGSKPVKSHNGTISLGTVEGKEGDFFNVTAYPFSTFQITEVATVEGKTMVSGNLTIKDKTHNISFPATISMEGNVLKLTSETFTIDRTQWGVNFGSKTVFDNLGEKFISDDIELTVNLVANKS